MKTIALLLVSFCVNIPSLAQQKTAPNQDPTTLVNSLFKAVVDEDLTALEEYSATDLLITSFDGQLVEGLQLRQGISAGAVTFDTGDVTETKTRQYGDLVGITTGVWKAKGNVQGTALDLNVAFTVVTHKEFAGWKIVHVQFTPIK